MRPKLSLIALLALLLSSTGCAFLDRENLILFNAFEENVVPDAQKRPGLHIATAPLTIPGGFCLLLLDALIVHPSRVVDDAWNDTVDACWDDLNWDEHYVTEASFLPVRCMGTPIVFLFDFLGRSIFAIPPYGQQDERRRKAAARK